MTIFFRYMRVGEEGDFCSCESCNSEAPLDFFSALNPGQRPRKLCEICANTTIGIHTAHYSGPDPVRESGIIAAQVANVLLDKLTQRRREMDAADVLQPEPDDDRGE